MSEWEGVHTHSMLPQLVKLGEARQQVQKVQPIILVVQIGIILTIIGFLKTNIMTGHKWIMGHKRSIENAK